MKPEPLQLDSRNAHSKLQIGDRLVVGDGVGGLMDQVRSVQPEDVMDDVSAHADLASWGEALPQAQVRDETCPSRSLLLVSVAGGGPGQGCSYEDEVVTMRK